MSSTITSLGTLSNSGTIHFDGSSAQTIPGNSSKGTQPLGDVTVDGANKTLSNTPANTTYTMTGLTFGGGSPDLEVNSQVLEFQNGTTISGATNDKHIIDGADVSVKYSSSSTSAITLPIGPDGSLREIKIQPVSGDANVYTVQYKTGTPAGSFDAAYPVFGVPVNHTNLTSINNDYYYDVTPTDNTKDTDITLGYVGLNTTPAQAQMYMIHWNDQGTVSTADDTWEEMTSSGDYATGTVTARATSYSPFGQGSGGGDPCLLYTSPSPRD